MFEYKVVTAAIRQAESVMNKWAGNGWRVITVTPNIAMGHGLVITFERERH